MRAPVFILLVCAACTTPPPGPTLTGVEPTVFDGEMGTTLAIRGTQLLPVVRFDFDVPEKSVFSDAGVSGFLMGEDGGRVELLDVAWVDGTQVNARVEGPVDFGVFSVHLIEPRGAELVLTDVLTSLQCFEGECVFADGGLVDAGTACEQLNYRDRDSDGFGSGTAVLRCGVGYASRGGDCDDRDNLTFPGGAEVCNGLDDDCDGTVDKPSCSDGGWSADDSLRVDTNDFVAASSFARGALWLATASRVFVRRGAAGYSELSQGCPLGITAVFATSAGEAEIAGVDLLASQSLVGVGCSDSRITAGTLVGMVAFSNLGSADYVGVRVNGDVWRWRLGEPPRVTASNLSADATVSDVHGTSAASLIAVGSIDVGGSPRARAWVLGADGGWQEERPFGSSSSSWSRVRLNSVWAMSSSSAVAVGENGSIALRSSGGWRRGWSDTTDDLTSVRAFSSTRYYVTTDDGRVRRRSGWVWSTVFRSTPEVPFAALAGTAEDDLWAVGQDGVIGRSAH